MVFSYDGTFLERDMEEVLDNWQIMYGQPSSPLNVNDEWVRDID